MEIPFEPIVWGVKINIHMIMEYLAFFIGFRYYVFLRKGTVDSISSINRLLIVLGAGIGALVGSRLLGVLENPFYLSELSWLDVYKEKTIIGGLLGGLFGVELVKVIIGEKSSSGDLFVFPLIAGIFIGRIGCLLLGIKEPTYGNPTDFFLGMDLGDGISRHPTSLYEMLFLIILFFALKFIKNKFKIEKGGLFKLFMVIYFSFRIFIEGIKPVYVTPWGLSSIQIACIILWIYYIIGYIVKKTKNA